MADVILRYSVDLTSPETFCLLEDGHTVRACIGEGNAERVVVELPIWFRVKREGSFHVRPLTGDLCTWLIESAVVHKNMARVTIQLSHVPEYIGRAMCWL